MQYIHWRMTGWKHLRLQRVTACSLGLCSYIWQDHWSEDDRVSSGRTANCRDSGIFPNLKVSIVCGKSTRKCLINVPCFAGKVSGDKRVSVLLMGGTKRQKCQQHTFPQILHFVWHHCRQCLLLICCQWNRQVMQLNVALNCIYCEIQPLYKIYQCK